MSSKRYHPVTLWLINHLRALTYGLGELIHAPFASLMTVAVIGVAMALPMGFYLLLQNMQILSQSWHGNPTITLYLKQNVAESNVQSLIAQLNHRHDIKNVKYISAAEGLAEFKRESPFGDILNALSENPLPDVLVLTPSDKASSPQILPTLLNSLKILPQVDIATLDMAWVKRLFYILTLGKRITYTLAVLFGIGVILIISNTIRLTMQAHRQEVSIFKLVGATTAFIRRPLLYRGFLYGFFGGIMAWLLVDLMAWWLASPAELLAASYGNHLLTSGVTFSIGLKIILLSAFLGWLGAFAVAQRHLISKETL